MTMNDETKSDKTFIVPLMLDGRELSIRFTGNSADRLSQHTIKEMTAKYRVQGATRLETMFRGGKSMAVFTLSIDDYDILLDKGKASGIYYAALGDKVNEQDVFDVFIKAEDITAFCSLIQKHKMKHALCHDAGVCIENEATKEESKYEYHYAQQQTAQNHRRYSAEVKEEPKIPPRPKPSDYSTANGKMHIREFLNACQEWELKYNPCRRSNIRYTPEEEALLHPKDGSKPSVKLIAEIIQRHLKDDKK